MLEALAVRAFFQFEFPLLYRAKPPVVTADASNWPAKFMLPTLVTLEDEEPFADVYGSWNEDGLQFLFDVPTRTSAFHVDRDQWWKHDGLRLCIDTRDTRDAKRATRFCHFYYCLPIGGGKSGKDPVVDIHRMSRAKEPPPSVDPRQISVAVQKQRKGYCIELALPASCLIGWNTVENTRLGLFYKLKDIDCGAQHLSANDDLGWNTDPSTWATAVLTGQ